MVDKKTVAIAILCVTATLCLGLYSNSAQEANRLKGGMRELEDDYDKLARVRTSLEENYSELRPEKEDLEHQYVILEGLAEYRQEIYLELIQQHETLKRSYNTLKEDYDVILEKESDYFERAVDAARSAIHWECLESWSGLADTDGNLHFVTEGIYVRSEIVKISYNTFGGRYDTFDIQIHAMSDGQITQEARWNVYTICSLEGVMVGKAYPLVASRNVYYLEITGKYTDDFMQKLEGGMGFTENLRGRDYDYAIGLSVPADLSP